MGSGDEEDTGRMGEFDDWGVPSKTNQGDPDDRREERGGRGVLVERVVEGMF